MKRSAAKVFPRRSLGKLNCSSHKHSTRQKKRRSRILQFLSSLVIPLVFGVFTIVITFHQLKLAREERLEDLSESRNQRQREEEHQRNLTDIQYKDQLLVAYIKDIAKLLEKHNGSLAADKTIANIARIKTLNIFRQLDADRNVQIIRFLVEAGQLNSTNVERSLDLSTAELKDVNFRDAAVNKKKLEFLFFNNAFLYNVTFAELELEENNFANTEFHSTNFSLCRLANVQFPSTTINDANFSLAIMENANFQSARLRNICIFNATFRIVDFRSALLQNTNFEYSQFIDSVSSNNQLNILTDFSSAILRKVDFSFAFVSKAMFESSTLENVNFAFSELFNVKFSSSEHFFKLNYSSAVLYNVTIGSDITMENIDFSHSRLVKINARYIKSTNMDFSCATLIDADLSSSELRKANFSLSTSRYAIFHQAKMAGTDLLQVTSVRTRFDDADLSHSNFHDANLKHVSFNGAILTNASFDGAILYGADFTDSTVTYDQLRTAFSIQDIVLPNGTVVKEKNLIRNGEAACNVSITGDWILENGIVNTSISHSSKDDCQFRLQSHATGATMSQRVELSGKWDSISWPYSKAVLTAHMSMNVTLVLNGLDSTGQIVLQTTLTKSHGSIDIVLKNTVKQLEVVIRFNPVINRTSNNATWCDNVRLFIIYGTYKELIRVIPNVPVNATWEHQGVTVAGGNGQGANNYYLRSPWGLFVDDDNDETILIADRDNHRIMQWKRGDIQGQVVAGGNGPGNRTDQLYWPTDVLIDKETNSLIIADWQNRRVVRWSRRSSIRHGEIIVENLKCFGLAMDEQRNLYVSNTEKHEVRRYEIDRRDKIGIIVAGGNGGGTGLNQFDFPAYLVVDRNQSLYVSDYWNHRVVKWDKATAEGIAVAGGQGVGSALTQLWGPNGIFVDTLGTLYVAEEGNNRVTRWPQGSEKKGTAVVGGNGPGSESNQFHGPFGLSFDKHGNLYVVDCNNKRVQRFNLLK